MKTSSWGSALRSWPWAAVGTVATVAGVVISLVASSSGTVQGFVAWGVVGMVLVWLGRLAVEALERDQVLLWLWVAGWALIGVFALTHHALGGFTLWYVAFSTYALRRRSKASPEATRLRHQ